MTPMVQIPFVATSLVTGSIHEESRGITVFWKPYESKIICSELVIYVLFLQISKPVSALVATGKQHPYTVQRSGKI